MEIGVDCHGRQKAPADWRTLGAFLRDGQDSLREQELIDMIPIYEMKAYNTKPEKTSRPSKMWLKEDPSLIMRYDDSIQNKPYDNYDDYEYNSKDSTDSGDDDDEVERKKSPYQRYGWQPVSIFIEPNERKKHEQWKLKKKVLDIQETEIQKCILWNPKRGDVNVHAGFISFFLRSGNPIFGQNFAPPVTFEFRGFTDLLGLCSLPISESIPQKRTMNLVFKQQQQQNAGGDAAIPNKHTIHAIRHVIRAKLKYSVQITGSAVGECPRKHSRTPSYRQFPVDFVYEHNGISAVTEMYEDIELQFYTNIEIRPIKK